MRDGQNGNQNVVETSASSTPCRRLGKRMIALLLIALALFAVLGFQSQTMQNIARKLFLSPAAYYEYLEGETIANGAAVVSDIYQNRLCGAVDPSDLLQTVNVRLETAETLFSIVSGYTRTDYSWLHQMELRAEIRRTGETTLAHGDVTVNDDHLLEALAIAEAEGQELIFQIPELTENVTALSYEAPVFRERPWLYRSIKALNHVTGVFLALPERETAEALLLRYCHQALASHGSVVMDRGKLNVNDLSVSCTVLTMTMPERDAGTLLGDLCGMALRDQELQQILEEIERAAAEVEMRAKVSEAIEDFRQKALQLDGDGELVMKLWVDDRGRIRGRRVEIGGTVLEFLCPRDGKRFQCTGTIRTENAELHLSGEGSEAEGVMEGSFVLSDGESPYLFAVLSDVDLDALKQGTLTGKGTFRATHELYVLLGFGQLDASYLDGAEYVTTLSSTPETLSADIRALLGEAPLFSVSIRGQTSAGGRFSKPESIEPIEAWLEQTVTYGGLDDFRDYLYDETSVPADYLNEYVRPLINRAKLLYNTQ